MSKKKKSQPSEKPLFKQVAYTGSVLLLLIGTLSLLFVLDKSSPVFTISIESDLTENVAEQLCEMIEEAIRETTVKLIEP